ncbi:MAG: hypothetical protein JWQ97_1656 [Phenylobacterium sp.]|nr:hypothetical protein [Phenylobacterium sp.]
MPQTAYPLGQPAFAVQGEGLSTYSQAGYADSSVANLIDRAVSNGANYVEFSNIVMADLTTGKIGDVIENGVDQTAPLADVGRAVDLAQAAGLNVLLKPQVAVHDPAFAQYNSASWINMVNPNLTIADPAAFFASYKAQLLQWANLAEQHHVAMLSVGNEMVAATKPQYTGYWNDIIDAVRQVYHGQLTYAALAPVVTSGGTNEISQIGFWGKLDVAGFDVYPSLVQTKTPTVQDLVNGWHDDTVYGNRQDYAAFLNQMAQQVGKPVVFTETGLPSFDGASDRVATSDGAINDGVHPADQQEQADWWQAFFKTWAVNPPSWLKGLVMNNNDPGVLGSYYDTNYNVDGKLAEKVVTAWYGGSTTVAPMADSLAGGQGDDQLYIYGPTAPQAANQAASFSTSITVKLTGAILGAAAPVIHAYVNGVDQGAIALKAVDSGYVDASGVHFTTDQTYAFELPGLIRIDQLKIAMDSPASIGGLKSTTFFHAVDVGGVSLANASYTPDLGGLIPIAQQLTASGGGDVGQWAGGYLLFDASPWNAALAARTIGSAQDPIRVDGLGGTDTVHVLGAPLAYVFSRAADGGVHLSETSGLGQNAILNAVTSVAFTDGTQVWLGDVGAAPYRVGGAGNDVMAGGPGAEYLRGAAGADTITGGAAADTINGNAGADSLQGGAGDDLVLGGRDNDVLQGQDGADDLNGNLGDDTVDGAAGADTVRGGQGNDVLFGGDGADWLSGDRGDDTLSGGAGADTFHASLGSGLDKVLDFNAQDGDRIQLDPGVAYTVAQQGPDTVITLGGGADRIVLAGVQADTLPSGWLFEP